MKPAYRIKDWDAHFESAESRKLNKTRWVPMPTKQDGKGYRRIAQHPDGIAIFCAWNLIVQVASKMPTRGLLVDSDGPLDADDLSVKTGFPAAMFSTALDFLASDKIGWIVVGDPLLEQPEPARDSQNPPDIPATRQSSSPEGKGIEGNGIEEKGKEHTLAAQAREVFVFWQEHMDHPRANLDEKRMKAITQRLRNGYSVDDLRAAVRGCKLTPFNMGKNDREEVYDGIDLICRDADHVDKFIRRAGDAVPTVEDRKAREDRLRKQQGWDRI